MLLTLNLTTLADRLSDKWRSMTVPEKKTRRLMSVGLGIENLESRELLTTYTVTTNLDEVSDESTTSLREAIDFANAHAGEDTINFSDNAEGSIDLLFGQLVITDSVTIQGRGATHTIINAQHNSRVFDLTEAVEFVVLDGLTVANGQTTGAGESGAGIRSLAGTLNVFDCAITGNSTSGDGSLGAGIFALNCDVSIFGSTISDNSTTGPNSGGSGVRAESGMLNLQNSTVSGNSSLTVSAVGGAVSVDGGGLAVTSSTIAWNISDGTSHFGGGISASNSNVALTNSIVAKNTNAGAPDLSQTSGNLSITYSLIGNNLGTTLVVALTPNAGGNLIGSDATPIDPLLGPLAYNGGSTQTHALLATSPALDRGLSELAADAADQRGEGFERVAGASVDMGAYERQPLSLLVTTAADEDDADFDPQDLSLREALALANSYLGMDTITFASSLDGTPLLLTLGQLTITDTVRINGSGVDLTVIDAQMDSRVFDITSTAGDVTFHGLTIFNGMTVGDGEGGGGIRSAATGTLTLTNTNVSGNTTAGADAAGGGISLSSTSTLVLTNSAIEGNTTLGINAAGGGVYAGAGGTLIASGTRISANTTSSDNSPGGGVFWDSGTVTFAESILSDNTTHGADSSGGGISSNLANVTLTDTTVSGNMTIGSDSAGGGVYSWISTVNLYSTTVSDNSTHGANSSGGGVRVDDGELILVNSTIANNSTTDGTAAGGGLAVGAASLSLTNCTVAFNSAAAGTASGGGISAATGDVDVFNSIVAKNSSSYAPDIAPGLGVVFVRYSLIGNNTGTDLSPVPMGFPDANGNLIGTAETPTDPQLGLLAAFGGPTKTYSLQGISPAINAGSNDLDGGLTIDQRGLPRVFDNVVDMGAFEHQSVPTQPSVSFSIAAQSVGESDGTITVTVGLSFASPRNVTIPLLISGSATNSGDYTISTSTLVIGAGATSGSISITIVDDSFLESNETIVLAMGTIINGEIGGIPDETITITNEDTMPSIGFSLAALSIAESGGVVSITLNLSAASELDTTIPFTFSGTAGNPSDYVTSGASPVVIPAGATSATFEVTILDDSVFEPNETIIVSLGTPTNGAIGVNSVETLTISDNDEDTGSGGGGDGGTGGGGVVTNVAPVLGSPGTAPVYRHNPRATRAPVKAFADITVDDPNGTTDLAQIVISVSQQSSRSRDVISYSGVSALGTLTSVLVNGRREVRVTLATGVTSAQVQTFLRSVTFATSGGGLRSASREFRVSVTDRGGLTSNVVTQTVGVSKN